MSSMSSPPGAAWYQDPADASRLRWWDGSAWTQHTQINPAGLVTPAPDTMVSAASATGSASTVAAPTPVAPAAQATPLAPTPVAPAVPAAVAPMAIPASATPDPVVPNFTAAVGPAMTGGAAGGMTNDHFGGESVATPNAQSIGDPGDRLAPLDRQRIIDMMGRLGWRFMIDDDGDVYASFSGQPTWFEQRGQQNELFVVLARWDVSLPRDQGWAALSVINQFNRETSFASAFLVDLPEQGYASVMCSLVLDCECGVTDKQLALHARDAVSGAAQLFKLMAQTFPDLH